jgi:hypothetical protein
LVASGEAPGPLSVITVAHGTQWHVQVHEVQHGDSITWASLATKSPFNRLSIIVNLLPACYLEHNRIESQAFSILPFIGIFRPTAPAIGFIEDTIAI